MKKALAVILTVFAVLTLCAPNAKAQAADASITGRVLDPANATVAGVTITVINTDTQVTHKAVTNGDGLYFVPNLTPGNYRVEAAKTGFKTTIKPDVILNIQDVTAINFNMILGTVAESVTVKGGASMINTTDGSVGTIVDRQFVENMPLNGRTFQSLIELTPGVVVARANSSGTNGQFSVDGQRADVNSFIVDGVSANFGAGQPGAGQITDSGNLPGLTAVGTTQPLASIDDLQEFKVQTSTFSAEYGTRPGGQIAVVTRSGSNQYHGNAFDYLRNTVFDANDWFANQLSSPQAAEHQNDFGGTFGGPVRIPGVYNGKDKTFFFFSYEGLRLLLPQFTLTNVPDLCLRGTAPATGPTSCASANNPTLTLEPTLTAVPAALLPQVTAFPIQNGPELGNGTADFSAGYSNPSNLNSTSIRVDHTINSKLTLFGRYSNSPSDTASPGNDLSSITTVKLNAQTLTLGATWLLTPKINNDLRLNFTSNNGLASELFTTFGGATIPARSAVLPAQFDPGTGASGTLDLVFSSRTASGPTQFALQDNYTDSQHQFNIVDSFSYIRGAHQFKFGVDYRRLTPVNSTALYTLLGEFFSASTLDKGVADAGSVAAGVSRRPVFTNFAAFGQDTWKVNRRLTLTLGLRWEVDPAPGANDGRYPVAATEVSTLATIALAPVGTPQWQTTWLNFAPRLGGAYILRDAPGWQTVLRGGWGIFYDTGNNIAAQAFGFPYSATSNITGLTYPYVASQVAPPTVPIPITPPYAFGIFLFDPRLQLPFTYQWNVAVEQSLGKSQTLTVTYVGNTARRLTQDTSQSIHAINPNFNSISLTINGATSDYDALQAQYQRRLARGLQALVSYTWAHALDYDSSSFTGFTAIRGNSAFDIRHTLSAGLTYNVPAPGNSALSRAILGHWSIDTIFQARSAPPVDITGSVVTNPATGAFANGRPFVVPGIPWYISGPQCVANYNAAHTAPGTQITSCPGGRQLNNNPNAISLAVGTAAGCRLNTAKTALFAADGPFCSPATGVVGNLGRNQVRALGAWQQDIALQREFPIHERLQLLFRAEAFNLFNHPNFGSPSVSVGAANFGQPTAMLNNALGGGLNTLYQIGGPRSMQFALKLRF